MSADVPATPLALGVAGCGSMGQAFLKALADETAQGAVSLFAWNRTLQKALALKAAGLPITVCQTPEELAGKADIVFLCVKPPQIIPLVGRLAHVFSEEKRPDAILVSIAAAVSLESLRRAVAGRCHALRVMPTTTLAVGAGVFALAGDPAPDGAASRLRSVLSRMGSVHVMSEKELGAFSAAIGCAPGFIFHLIQGLVDGAVALGIPRPQACEMMLATVLGCARLAQENRETHLCALRDQVASPGGMTIQGLAALERAGVNGQLIDALQAAYDKGMQMERA